jgi:hypothetical protein
MVTEICQRLWEKYEDKIIFSFLGLFPVPLKGKLPDEAWLFHEGMGQWSGYPKCLAGRRFDIGIAPLKPTDFNASRSAIKWMEYTLTDTPTVASNWGEYPKMKGIRLATTIQDWITELSNLIENQHERRKLVTEARSNLPTVAGWREVCEKYAGHGFVHTDKVWAFINNGQ